MAVTLTQKEEEKLSIIYQTIQGTVTIAQAATMLSISPRQIKRLKKKVRTEGEAAVVHKLKGQQSNHHVDEAVKETGATDIKEMGAVIGKVIQKAKGNADGGKVAALVKEKLTT